MLSAAEARSLLRRADRDTVPRRRRAEQFLGGGVRRNEATHAGMRLLDLMLRKAK